MAKGQYQEADLRLENRMLIRKEAMRSCKKFTIERTMSDRRLSPSDIERIESLLATFIAKAIIEGRLTGQGVRGRKVS